MMPFMRDWLRIFTFKVYTTSKAVYFVALHTLAGDLVFLVKLCAKCTGSWMSFLAKLFMLLVNSVSYAFAEICA